jgi:hypothetical protein
MQARRAFEVLVIMNMVMDYTLVGFANVKVNSKAGIPPIKAGS